MYVCMRACMRACMHACVYVRHVRMHIGIRTHAGMYVCMHACMRHGIERSSHLVHPRAACAPLSLPPSEIAWEIACAPLSLPPSEIAWEIGSLRRAYAVHGIGGGVFGVIWLDIRLCGIPGLALAHPELHWLHSRRPELYSTTAIASFLAPPHLASLLLCRRGRVRGRAPRRHARLRLRWRRLAARGRWR